MKSFVCSTLVLSLFALSCSKPDIKTEPEKKNTPPAAQQNQQDPAQNKPAVQANPQDTAVVTHIATMKTNMGTITLGLYGIDAPKTVANFEALSGKKFFDGILFHRVAPDFVIQAGDPNTKDPEAKSKWGQGGETADGQPLADEVDPSTPSGRAGYQPGVLAMANTGQPNSGSCQFFICLDKASTLPLQYSIFGKVIGGADVVQKIAKTELEDVSAMGGIPKKPVEIQSLRVAKVGK